METRGVESQLPVISFLQKRSKAFVLVAGLVTICALGVADYYSGLIGFALFYLIPIVLVTWVIDRRWGIAFSVGSVVILAGAEHLTSTGMAVAYRFWNAFVFLVFFIVIVVLLSRVRDALDLETRLARTDGLTGVVNGRFFYEIAGGELERAKRYDHPLSIAYLDLDNFKEVNDHFGHASGDEALRLTVKAARSHLRSSDVLARIGGDEFVVLLPETDAEPARMVVDRMRSETVDAMKERGWPVTMSVGLVTFEQAPGSTAEMVKEADSLMYTVKNGGKNALRQVVVGEPRGNR